MTVNIFIIFFLYFDSVKAVIIAVAIVVYNVVKLFTNQESLDIVDVLFNQASDV